MLNAKPVVVSDEARKDMKNIFDNLVYLSYSATPALKLMNAFDERIELIGLLPEGIGRLRPEPNTRESFVKGYRIVYEIMPDVIYVKTVIHSRMLYPRP